MATRGESSQPGRNNERGRRNDYGRTFQRINRYGQWGVNCAVVDEVNGEEDNVDYFEEDRDRSD